MRTLLLVVLALGVAPPPGATAATRSIALVVTDADGGFVPDLRPEEVQVLENGEPRERVGFERDERPLAVALVLDTSTGAARVFRVQALDALAAFRAALPPGTKCTLWSTGDHPRKVGEVGPERESAEKRVAQAFGLDGANALLDALVEAADALRRESGRRRALVVVSGAGAGHTNLSPGDVVAETRKAAARVVGVLYREGASGAVGPLSGLDAPRDAANLTIVGASDHERILDGLAQATGGRFESVGTAIAVARVLESMAAELGGQYRLRYAGSDAKGPKRVEVRLARPGVRWRVAVDAP
jgi:VWFA-related protein